MGNICAHQMQRRFCKCETTDRKTWLINERRVSSTIVGSHGLLAFGNRCKINHHQMLWVCALCSRRINEWENGKFECRKCMSTNFTPSLNSFRVQTHVLRNIRQSTHTHTRTHIKPTKLPAPRSKFLLETTRNVEKITCTFCIYVWKEEALQSGSFAECTPNTNITYTYERDTYLSSK